MQIMKSKRIKIAIVIVSTILFSVFGTANVYAFIYRDRILPGVKIESLDVGGLTVDAATRRVEKAFKPQGDLKLVFKDIKQTVDLDDIGAEVRAKQSAHKAFAVGRNRGFFEDSRQRYYALTSGFRIQVTWTSDAKKTRAALKRAAKIIEQPPINAKLLIDQKNVSIEPHQEGRELLFAKSLARFRYGFYKKSKKIELAVKTSYPDKTTKDIKKLRIEKQLAEYSTSLSPTMSGRRKNIELAMSKIDGTHIGPGENFSFNDTVGKRTSGNGFLSAPVIQGGRLVPGIGGGICQVATTLYNASMISGLTTVERSVHSFYISHYPTGRDATVVDGQLDFKFKNDTNGTLLIKTFILSNAVGFKIYGPDSGRENIFGKPQIYNVTAYSSKTETDTSLPPGARVVDQSGIPGRTVSVLRKVMKKGKKLFEEKIVSRYTARQEIIKVGPAPPPEEPALSNDSTTTTETVSDTDET